MHLKLKNLLQWDWNDGTHGHHVECEMCLYSLSILISLQTAGQLITFKTSEEQILALTQGHALSIFFNRL